MKVVELWTGESGCVRDKIGEGKYHGESVKWRDCGLVMYS